MTLQNYELFLKAPNYFYKKVNLVLYAMKLLVN